MYRRSPGASTRSTRAQNIRLRAIAASASAVLAVGSIAGLAVPAQAVPTVGLTPDSGPTTGGTQVTFPKPPVLEFSQIAVGGYSTLALTSDGVLYGWGNNSSYQLGRYHAGESAADWTESNPFPLAMPDGVTYETVSAGLGHALAIGADGNVYAWGDVQHGSLGVGDISQPYGPVQVSVPPGVTFDSVVAGYRLSLALDSSGRAYSWGDGADGKLGNGTTSGYQWVPAAVTMPAGVAFTSVDTGYHHALALGSDGNAYAWGRGANGALGNGDTADRAVPTRVAMPPGVTFTSVAAGGDTSWALDTHGNAWSWGNASYGQLGNGVEGGSNALVPAPVSMPAGVTFTSVQGARHHALATGSDGHTYAWGDGYRGRLGTGSEADQYEPTQVATPAGVTLTQVGGGAEFSAGLDSTGTLYSWGYNSQGELGDGYTKSFVLAPTEIPRQFAELGQVRFGNRWGTGRTYDADTGMWSVTAPAHAAGTVEVTAWWYIFRRTHEVSLPDAFTYVATVPGTPGDVSGVPGNGEVELTWDTPDGDGGSAITDYVVEYSADGGTTWAVFDDGVSATPGATVTGLTNGTAYVFRVTAVNEIGASEASELSVSVTPVTVPSAPTDVAGVAGDGEVALTWDAPDDDGGSAITDYVVEYSADGGATWAVFDDGVSATPGATVAGLTNGTVYLFRVTAVNEIGVSGADVLAAGVTPVAAEVPDDTEVPADPATPDAPVVDSADDELAATGFASGSLLGAALLLMAAGVCVVVARRRGASARSTRAQSKRSRAIAASASALLAVGSIAVLAVPAQAVPTFDITPDSGPTTGGTHVSFLPEAELQFVQIASGDYFTIALTTDGEVYGWGNNYAHQLAKDHPGNYASDWVEDRPFALTMPEGVTYEAVTAGMQHSLAIGSDGNVYAWGDVLDGRLGAGPMSQPTGPVQVSVPSGVTFTSVVAGKEFSLALDAAGEAYSWGGGADGTLGNGTTSGSQWVPTAVTMPAGVTFTSMAAGLHHALALGSDGNAYAWGSGANGALGNGDTADRAVPTRVAMPPGVMFTSVSVVGNTSFALDTHGNAWSWGSASHGQLGNGVEVGPNALAPVAVSMPAGVSFTTVQGGTLHVLATGSDGNAYAWGGGIRGRLGTGSEADQYEPTQVATPAGVTLTQVDGGEEFSAGLDSTGSLFTWGNPTFGVLGDGYVLSNALVPQEVPNQRGRVGLVRFGDRFANSPWLDGDTGMWTAATPVHAAGTVDVRFNWYVFGRLHPVTLTDAFTFVEPLIAPGAPTGVVGVAGDGQVVLTWQVPDDDGGSAITDYVVEYSADGGVTWTVFDDGVSTTAGATVTGLTNGTAYVFRVTAVNEIGDGEAGELSAGVVPVTVPAAPTGVVGVAGDGEVALTWAAPDEDGGSAITDYLVEYSADGGVTWAVFDDGMSTTAGATVTGLTNGTAYLFRVTAVNEIGAGVPGELLASVTPISVEVPMPEPDEGPAEQPTDPVQEDSPATVVADDQLATTGFAHGNLSVAAWLLIATGLATVVVARFRLERSKAAG